MKKLLMVIMVLISLVSCKKEVVDIPIIACKCNDGSIVPGNSSSACGDYILTTNGVSVKLNRGGVKEYIRSTKTFCEVFPMSAYCLGRNY